jgi:hypothetical protein
VRINGGLDAQTVRLEDIIGRRAAGGGIIVSDGGTDGIGVRIERSFTNQFARGRACFPRRGIAVRAGKLARLPRPAIDLAGLISPD